MANHGSVGYGEWVSFDCWRDDVSIGGLTTTDLYVSILKSETVKNPIIDRFKLMAV
jgi:hypothetical protein